MCNRNIFSIGLNISRWKASGVDRKMCKHLECNSNKEQLLRPFCWCQFKFRFVIVIVNGNHHTQTQANEYKMIFNVMCIANNCGVCTEKPEPESRFYFSKKNLPLTWCLIKTKMIQNVTSTLNDSTTSLKRINFVIGHVSVKQLALEEKSKRIHIFKRNDQKEWDYIFLYNSSSSCCCFW